MSIDVESESPAIRLAVEYLDALRVGDWERARELADEGLWYFDPTMEIFDRPAIDLRGRDAALAFYAEATEVSDTTQVSWRVVDAFEAGPWVVLELRLSVEVAGTYWNVDRDRIELTEARQITALRVEGSRVTDHIDLVAYGDALEQIEALRARHGSVD